jgi:tRNA-2-methylthio-N6-dimethylallyladenosine synthase
MSLSYHITTYGCQMNVHDSEVMAGLLEDLGYERAHEPEQADLVLLNTCCVRETAEERILGRLGELQRLKRDNPDLLLVVAGCLGQEAGAAERIRRRAAQVDVIMGTHNLYRLPELVAEAVRTRACRGGEPVVEVWREEANSGAAAGIGAGVAAGIGAAGASVAGRAGASARLGEIRENLPIRRQRGVRAWVTIMYGCDNFCSYCIVPSVRGRERSRLPEDIRREVRDLVAAGYREVMLLGQNVNSYGLDLGPGPGRSFAGLLRELDGLPGMGRIRYTTSHPRNFTDDIISAVAESEHVCENFHLPAQSGSTRILRAMNRHYDREDYLGLIDRIRGKVPGAAFTTDLIVGFPGETGRDFEDTLSLVREVGFASSFTFAYSPRTGTPASSSPGQLPAEVKQDRLAHLIEVQNEVSLQGNRAEIGRDVAVLVEGEAEKAPGRGAGRSRTNKLVVFSAETVGDGGPPGRMADGTRPGGVEVSDLLGREVTVRVERATTWSLEGRASL